MSVVEGSYLGAWTVVATLLVLTGGLGLVLAPVALACGVHRARAWSVLRRAVPVA